MRRLHELGEWRGLRDVGNGERASAGECGVERRMHAEVHRLAFARSDTPEPHGGGECAAQAEMKERGQRFVARDAERTRHEPKGRREVPVELALRHPRTRFDEHVVTEAARSNVEECAALRAAGAGGDVTPQRGARECVELGEPRWIIVHRGGDRQRAMRELIDVLDAEPLDARELAELQHRFEPGRVREPAGRKRRVRELQHDPRRHGSVYNVGMRVCIGLVVIACIACKKADSPPKQGSAGSGSATVAGDAAGAALAPVDAVAVAVADAAAADAGPPLAKFCATDDDGDGAFREVASDPTSISFCIAREEQPTKCAKLDLASGTFTAIAEQPEVIRKVAQDKVDASTLELPKGDHEWATAKSADGKTIAAITDIQGQLFIVDAETKKVRKVVKWSADGGCMEAPSFIGDNIYVQYNVCAGPGATGWFVSPEGKKLGSLKRVDPTGRHFPVGGNLYAFEDFAASGIEVADAKTGKSVRYIELPSTVDCNDCVGFRTGNLAIAQVGTKLVQFGARVYVVDAAAGKVEKTIPWPKCPEAP